VISAVFDTVIFVRCLINPASRWGRLVFARTRHYRLVTSEPTIRETLEVISRPRVARKFRTASGLDRQAVLAILATATVVDVREIRAISRDPKDDPFLATARAAGAAFLVTEDEDLLVLGTYNGTRIVNAETFLAILDELDEAAEGDTSTPC
jgi:putative PIN family toxin of toxin-antitoxin system